MNNLEELLKMLGIQGVPTENDTGHYTVKIESSNAFNNLYSRIEASKEFDQDISEFELSEDKTKVVFLGDYFSLELNGDFDNDVYTLDIYEVGE